MSELIDNSQQRIETLRGIIQGLHRGEDSEEVKRRLAELVGQTTSQEIVGMEQQLIADGMSVEEIKKMCDLHAQVMGEIVEERVDAMITAGHPCHTFTLENRAIATAVAAMRSVIAELNGLADDETSRLSEILGRWRATLTNLLEVEKHYARKENLLFSYLERHGITGPSQVMWGKDDDIRAMMKALREAMEAGDASIEEWKFVAENLAAPLLEQVEEMIRKEEKILLPLSLSKLKAEEWGAIYRESPRFGYCLVEPGTAYEPPPLAGDATGIEGIGEGRIRFGTGNLTVAQLSAVFRSLPVDLTFVDAEDRVAFFSEGRDRIFSRSAAVIGRKVQNCHPPASVEVVDRILDDFKAGRQDVAEFWITHIGRFVHIRYFAVRGEGGDYLGTLEVTQDLTPLRALEGERRLLEYDAP